MEKKEWLQALLDGNTMTSDEAKGTPICFNSNGKFEYINIPCGYSEADVNSHKSNLRECEEPIIEEEEMTLEEVCKIIGKNIKIVKG